MTLKINLNADIGEGLAMLARGGGVSLGVHPGFNDLWGFGRRRINMDPRDLELMVACQIGALPLQSELGGPADAITRAM